MSLNVNLNTPNKNRLTPLHLACTNGHLDIVKMFIEKNARMNAVDLVHETPLFKAIRGKWKKITQYLIVQHAAVNIYNKNKDTVLHMAVKYENFDLVAVLLRVSGSNPNRVNNEG